MSKASEWQDLVTKASAANYAARDAQPTWEHWEPWSLMVKARATSAESMELETQKAGAKVRLDCDTAVRLARWILDTFEEAQP